jgi:hypothetical protein
MKQTLLFFTAFFCIMNGTAQNYFNRVYRFDPIKGNATVFFSLKAVNNAIYTAGIGVLNVTDTTVSNSGIFSSFDMPGNLIKNTYYGVIPTNSDFTDDVMLTEPNTQFSLIGYNFERSLNFLKVDKEGNILFKKKYFSTDSTYAFGAPTTLTKIDDKYAFGLYTGNGQGSKSVVYIVDSFGNTKREIDIYDAERSSHVTQIIKNKKNNLTLSLYHTSKSSTDSGYVYISQLREIDTLGNTLWTYNTPRNKFIFLKKFVQLANGNYLVWGDEELSNTAFNGTYWVRTVYDGGPYLAEINSQRGLIWEKRFGLKGRMRGFKILRDSTMILTCSYDDEPNNTTACMIKLNKSRDSLYRRNFRAISLASENVLNYANQIEELNNGDLLIGGYVWDSPVRSPTTGQWGWLVRTDSMGCSLEPSSCRTPTQDIEKPPLSMIVYPNPTSGKLNLLRGRLVC